MIWWISQCDKGELRRVCYERECYRIMCVVLKEDVLREGV